MISLEPKSYAPGGLKCDLAAELLGSSGRVRLRAAGRSMLPTIWPGDTLLVENVDANAVSEGDIVLFRRAHQFFAHRVVSRVKAEGATILTRGDAMAEPDPPLAAVDLLGKISFIVRDGRLIEATRNVSRAHQAVAGVLRRSETAARIIVGVHGVLMKASQRQNSHDRAVPCPN